MEEFDLRQRVVATATAWLGRKESDGSHREILKVYNAIRPLPRGYRMKDTDPWCAAFVSAVGAACGLSDVIFPECSCPRMIALYEAAGRWSDGRTVVIRPGDLIFYDWDGDKTADHVGLIVEVAEAGYRVIEGNKSDAVSYRTVLPGYAMIRGFAIPAYWSKAQSEGTTAGAAEPKTTTPTTPAEVPQQTETDDSFQLSFHVLRFGAGMGTQSGLKEQVRAVQRELKALGFDIGRWGTDGEFGNDTKQAVAAYQKSVRISPTGEVDKKTRAALAGLN